MMATIDGVTVMGTPDEIKRFKELSDSDSSMDINIEIDGAEVVRKLTEEGIKRFERKHGKL